MARVCFGNHRAARFYEKRGGQPAGTVLNSAETSSEPFPLEVWRYENGSAARGEHIRSTYCLVLE